VVDVVETTYTKGVRLKREEMEASETQVKRLPTLEKWFVEIPAGIPEG
jgi:hypothetical protein